MTDVRYDRAPGDIPTEEMQAWTPSKALIYTIGLLVAFILTATSFWVANTSLLWPGGVGLGLAVLAIAQMGIHLVFFLHILPGRTAPTTYWRLPSACSSYSWWSPGQRGL
jgi:cytochrome o ubiquinol oxidase subunit IV